RLALRRARQNNTMAMKTPASSRRIIPSTFTPSLQSSVAATTPPVDKSTTSSHRRPANQKVTFATTSATTKPTYSSAVANKGKATATNVQPQPPKQVTAHATNAHATNAAT